MRRINWLYNFATYYVKTFKPRKVYHSVLVYLVMYILLLYITVGLTNFVGFVIGVVLGAIAYRYIRKKVNQLLVLWSIYYMAKHYSLED